LAESIPVTDFKDLTKLYTEKHQNRDPARSDLRPIHALDTETYLGNVFLIADSDGRFLDKITADSLLDFLFSRKYEGTWNFFWNITYDAEVILKLLGNALYAYVKTRRLSFTYKGYHVHYIPNKSLRITKGHHSVTFYDIAQFFNRSGLAKAFHENISQLPQDYLNFKAQRSEFSPTFYRRNTTAVRNYCIDDCKYTKALAEKWISLFHSAFGFYPQRWISSGYLAEKVLINSSVFMPKFDSIPYEIQNLAMRSYFGGRFEILKRGFIGEAHLYDINSAYPFAITQIPDLSDGKWIRRKTIHSEANIGFFRIIAEIPDIKRIPPFLFRVNGNLIFPSGKFETYVTLDELLACQNEIHYRILDSWQFVPKSDFYPYKQFIENLYNKRLELKKKRDPLQLPIKIILNSIYGKTDQKVNRVIGNLFNPVIFATITGKTRAQLYRFMVENDIERDIVAFATDSICVTRKLDFDSSMLGDFSLADFATDVYYLQNGIYRFNGKWKQRGFGKLDGKDIEHLDTVESDGRLYYRLKLRRNTRLRSSILQNRLSEIGEIKPVTREINLNADRKRFWLGTITSVELREFNDSMPISFNHFRT
jgi:hypothetical protein